MTTTHAAQSVFAHVELAPRDPILGITEAFLAETNPKKVNLGVGVYCDDSGKVPLLDCVRQAEQALVAKGAPHSYLPIDGLASYDKAVQALLLGATSEVIASGRGVTVQAIGGTGALRIGADFLRRFLPGSDIWISDPSWENHRALFEAAGFTVHTYPYYDETTLGLKAAAMLDALDRLPAGAVVLLHACCHNPTGVDPTSAEWERIIEVVRRRHLVPFLDLAYQGFAEGLDADGEVVRRFAATPGPLLASTSFSKSFSLYGERARAPPIVPAKKAKAARVLSQVKRVIRANYSNPPSFGGQVVANVLTTPDLRALWERELGGMRDRIRTMRQTLVERLSARVPGRQFQFMLDQRGMFSYSGLSKEQVQRLREKYAIFAVDTGRICVAALNSRNIDYVTDSLADVY